MKHYSFKICLLNILHFNLHHFQNLMKMHLIDKFNKRHFCSVLKAKLNKSIWVFTIQLYCKIKGRVCYWQMKGEVIVLFVFGKQIKDRDLWCFWVYKPISCNVSYQSYLFKSHSFLRFTQINLDVLSFNC